MEIVLALIAGLILGAVVAWVVSQKMLSAQMTQREMTLQSQMTAHYTAEIQTLQIQLATVSQSKQMLEEQLAQLHEKELLLSDTQSKLSGLSEKYQLLREETDAWKTDLKQRWDAEYKAFLLEHLGLAQTQFSEKATKEQTEKQKLLNENIETLLKPMAEKLSSLEEKTIGLAKTNIDLKDTAARLTMTLSDNKRRGNWGEAQLEGLLEASGLQKGIHYFTQERLGVSAKTPDIRVQLADGRNILIDAKALHINMDELSMSEEQVLEGNYQEQSQKNLAKSLEAAVTNLSGKAYASDVENAASFVILFVPKESMLASAMTMAPGLFEKAYQNNIILAGPYNLMGLLKLINQGWRMNKLSSQANEILRLGQDLYKQAETFASHFDKVGQHLEKLTDAYRKTTTSFNGKQGFLKRVKTLEEFGADIKAKSRLLEEVTEVEPFLHTSESILITANPVQDEVLAEPYLLDKELAV